MLHARFVSAPGDLEWRFLTDNAFPQRVAAPSLSRGLSNMAALADAFLTRLRGEAVASSNGSDISSSSEQRRSKQAIFVGAIPGQFCRPRTFESKRDFVKDFVLYVDVDPYVVSAIVCELLFFLRLGVLIRGDSLKAGVQPRVSLVGELGRFRADAALIIRGECFCGPPEDKCLLEAARTMKGVGTGDHCAAISFLPRRRWIGLWTRSS